MKGFVLAAVALALVGASGVRAASPAGATGTPAATAASPKGTGWEQVCAMYSKYAAAAERARQTGVPESRIITKIEETTSPGANRNMFEHIVIEAYQEPHVTDPDLQKQVIGDFRDHAFSECAQNIGPH